MRVIEREVGRRKVLQVLGIGGAAVTFGSLGAIGFLDREVFDRPTSEQTKAKKLIETLYDSNPNPDLIVTGDLMDDGKSKAYFRDKPRVPSDKDDFEAGNGEGSLKIGARITKWIAVVGNGKENTIDLRQTDRWISFIKGDRAYFAHKSLFDDLGAIENAELFDLSKLK